MAETFLPSPRQSLELSASNIDVPLPISLDELTNRAILTDRKRGADGYSCCLDPKRIKINPEDIYASEDYKLGCQVALLMPSIVSAVSHLVMEPVLTRLDAIQANQVHI